MDEPIHTLESSPYIRAPMYGCQGTLRWALKWVFFRLPMRRLMVTFVPSQKNLNLKWNKTEENMFFSCLILCFYLLFLCSRDVAAWLARQRMCFLSVCLSVCNILCFSRSKNLPTLTHLSSKYWAANVFKLQANIEIIVMTLEIYYFILTCGAIFQFHQTVATWMWKFIHYMPTPVPLRYQS